MVSGCCSQGIHPRPLTICFPCVHIFEDVGLQYLITLLLTMQRTSLLLANKRCPFVLLGLVTYPNVDGCALLDDRETSVGWRCSSSCHCLVLLIRLVRRAISSCSILSR